MLVEEKSEDVKVRIVASALREFGQNGFAGASVRKIAEGAHTTKPMIYYYFGNKEGLYASAVGNQMRALAGRLLEAVTNGSDPVQKLRLLLGAYLEFFVLNRETVAVSIKEILGVGEPLVRTVSDTYAVTIVDLTSSVIAEGIDERVFRPVDVLACSLAILGAANMFVLRHLVRGVVFDPRTVVDQITDCCLRGIFEPGFGGDNQERL